ncbi:MAG TPA: GNAT family N-acetyltransferase [Kineosporiaceae bacterium]|nr:GNAT family N-acetyltransferase [Kineosporiaceae bacterium]
MTNDLHQPGELRLRPMTTDELPAYLTRLEIEYAAELHESTGISQEAAKEEARQSTLESFPDGQIGQHEQIWVAEDVDGARVGVLWLAHREPGTPKEHAWIYDIEIDQARRGEGWGRKLLALAEAQTRALGLTSLRLNVFGQNSVARELYRTQGFAESRVTMVKDVAAGRSAGSEPPTASFDIVT